MRVDILFCPLSLNIFGVDPQIKRELIESVKGKKKKKTRLIFLSSIFNGVARTEGH